MQMLYFSNSFAVQDGKLRVFKWPSLEVLFNEETAYTTVKDLHFRLLALAFRPIDQIFYDYTVG